MPEPRVPSVAGRAGGAPQRLPFPEIGLGKRTDPSEIGSDPMDQPRTETSCRA